MSISIIAVLIGILLPALGGARVAARTARCLSNNHQIAIAFTAYMGEKGHYPTHIKHEIPQENNPTRRTVRTLGHAMVSWGGVDFQPGDDDAAFHVARDRPVNPYIASGINERGRAEVFMCPGDNGILSTHNNQPVSVTADSTIANSVAEDSRDTVFGALGTSYRANDWMWSPIGRLYGWFDGIGRDPVYALNRPENVFRPSRFILTIDYAGWQIIRGSEEHYRVGAGNIWSGLVYNWWHKKDAAVAAFQDGSARLVDKSPGNGANSDFSFWIDERKHSPTSWVQTMSWQGTPRERLPSGPWEH